MRRGYGPTTLLERGGLGVRGRVNLLPRMVPNEAVLTIHVVPDGSLGQLTSTIIINEVG